MSRLKNRAKSASIRALRRRVEDAEREARFQANASAMLRRMLEIEAARSNGDSLAAFARSIQRMGDRNRFGDMATWAMSVSFSPRQIHHAILDSGNGRPTEVEYQVRCLLKELERALYDAIMKEVAPEVAAQSTMARW